MTQFDTAVSFGKVVGRLQLAVGDTTDDVDHDPDAAPAVGTVTFTPSVARLLSPSATIPSTIWAQPIVCSIDSEGYLCDPTGNRGVSLIATNDPDLEPTDWTYDVLIALTGLKQTFTSFAIAVPAGEEVDLAKVMPAAPSKGVSSYTPSIVEAAVSAAESALEAAATVADFELNTDAIVNGVATNPASAFNATLAKKIADAPLTDYQKLRPWFSDIANWRNKRADVLFIGDSNPEGYALTNWDNTSCAQLGTMLRQKHGIPAAARGFVGIQNDFVNKPFWPLTLGVPGGNITAVGYGANARQLALTATGHKITYSVATPLTSFYIHYANYGTGTFYYKVDGGAPVNINIAGGGTIIPVKALVTPVGGVTSTIEIGWVSGAAYIAGLQENKGDENSGLQIHNLGWSGSYAKLWNDAILANRSWAAAQAVFAPSLIVLNLGGNDGRPTGGNRTAAQFQADLTTLLNTLGTTVSTTAPIIVNMQWSLGDSALLEPWANYVAAAKAVCAASSRAILIDHSARMYPSNGSDPLGLYNAASLPHATAKGYALYAATIAKLLEFR